MFSVNPKKRLGQHFLTDKNIARKITGSLTGQNYTQVLEIGPGMGILSESLFNNPGFKTRLIEVDRESVEYLHNRFPEFRDQIIEEDFLRYSLTTEFSTPLAIIGNFPYNISSQIFFRIIENRQLIEEVVCMVQKEVAERIVSPPGSKVYGILSVLLQAWYKTEYLFSVGPRVFTPPPRVTSAVIRLTLRHKPALEKEEDLFIKLVKAAFNQRRKMLRNSLSSFLEDIKSENYGPLFSKRPEQLSVDDFVYLTRIISGNH